MLTLRAHRSAAVLRARLGAATDQVQCAEQELLHCQPEQIKAKIPTARLMVVDEQALGTSPQNSRRFAGLRVPAADGLLRQDRAAATATVARHAIAAVTNRLPLFISPLSILISRFSPFLLKITSHHS